jgi:hypothetical protein
MVGLEIEALTGLAMRKQGLTDPHYLDPRTSGQGELHSNLIN